MAAGEHASPHSPVDRKPQSEVERSLQLLWSDTQRQEDGGFLSICEVAILADIEAEKSAG